MCWSDLFKEPHDLTVQKVVEVTVDIGFSPEDLLGHLEKKLYPDISEGIANVYLKQNVLRLLPEGIIEADFFEAISTDGKKFFAVKDEQFVRDAVVGRVESLLGKNTTLVTQMAMTAHIEQGLGNYQLAICVGCLSLCEKAHPGFNDAFNNHDPHAEATADAEMSKLIELILETTKEIHANQQVGVMQ